MLVLNLACDAGHLFEGWFASADDCSDQQTRGLLSCPMCGSVRVERRPSAPRLNVSHLRAAAAAPLSAPASPQGPASSETSSGPTDAIQHVESGEAPPIDKREALQALWQAVSREVARQSEDVGERFAEEARRIHYGEVEERAIRGRSKPEEVRALMEEGIELMPLLLPRDGDGELH